MTSVITIPIHVATRSDRLIEARVRIGLGDGPVRWRYLVDGNVVPQSTDAGTLLEDDDAGEGLLRSQIPVAASVSIAPSPSRDDRLYFAAANPLGPAPTMQTVSARNRRSAGVEPMSTAGSQAGMTGSVQMAAVNMLGQVPHG